MKKRLLAICHLGAIAWGVGEILRFQLNTLIDRIETGTDEIDLVWLCDPAKPAFEKVGVSPVNCHYYLSKLLPLAHVNPHLGSFMLLNSMEQLKTFISANSDKYEVRPTLMEIRKKTPIYRNVFAKVKSFYDSHGFVPRLSCQPAMILWALSFFNELKVTHPIVVHLRKSGVRLRWNSNIEAWLGFFEHCKGKYKDVVFIVIGSPEERDKRFRKIGNVFFAKDYGTTAEQDCALIQCALMFMGGPSGPNTMAIHTDVPYLIFNFIPTDRKGSIPELSLREKQFPFATPFQKIFWGRENSSLLIKEFTGLLSQLSVSEWKKKFSRYNLKGLTRKGGWKPY